MNTINEDILKIEEEILRILKQRAESLTEASLCDLHSMYLSTGRQLLSRIERLYNKTITSYLTNIHTLLLKGWTVKPLPSYSGKLSLYYPKVIHLKYISLGDTIYMLPPEVSRYYYVKNIYLAFDGSSVRVYANGNHPNLDTKGSRTPDFPAYYCLGEVSTLEEFIQSFPLVFELADLDNPLSVKDRLWNTVRSGLSQLKEVSPL